MEPTYNYLKRVFPDLRHESKAHPAFLFLLISLLAIPLSYGSISLALAALVLVTLIRFKKNQFRFETALLLPILLFVLMTLSLCWTIDPDKSLRALQKGLPLVLVPLCFMMFPALSVRQKQKIIGYFSLGLLLFVLFWLAKAAVRFVMTRDVSVFFYHELVTEDINAIHVSIYAAVAFFYWMAKPQKTRFDKFAMALMAIFLVLLSSKNIIVIFVLLVAIYGFRLLKSGQRSRSLKWIAVGALLATLALMGKIRERFAAEMKSGHSLNYEISAEKNGNVYNVSVLQAWTQERFRGNDFFPGTAFRVYQMRIFKEMLQRDNIFFTGYGLNATGQKIRDKGLELGVYTGEGKEEGYLDKNFHNEYVQLFAELGIFGLLVLIAILAINLKNAIQTKDFVHISFAILMISLFLTESFLSRQRGIVFFILLYCLLNSKSASTAQEHEE
jgi:O-antigen ligase